MSRPSSAIRLLCALLIWCLSTGISRTGPASDVGVALVPGSVPVAPNMQLAVSAAIHAAAVLPDSVKYAAITDVRQDGSWALVSVIGLAHVDADLHWGLDDGAWFGLVLLMQAEAGQGIGATQGTLEFSSLLDKVPEAFLSSSARADLDPLRPSAVAATSTYVFPWQPGTSMFYGYLGVHANGFTSIVGAWKAVDMLSDGNAALGHAPNRVLASSGGTIGYKCTDPNNVAFRLGDFFYTHLVDNPGLTTGAVFAQGAELGQMKTGSFGTTGALCGWATQPDGTFHVHWGFPDADLHVEGWTLSMSTQNWTNGVQTVSPGGGWIVAGVPAPSRTISGNAGVPHAVLSYDDAGPKQVHADSTGAYTFTVPDAWSGTVTPGAAGFSFAPSNRSYAHVYADDPGEDYIASPDVLIYRSGALLSFDFNSGAYASGVWLGNPGANCIPALMDQDGDGALEYSQFCGGAWIFYDAAGTPVKAIWTGIPSGIPVPADYDGDGTDDVVVFQGGAWQFFDYATGDYLPGSSKWTGLPGGAGKPAPMDYNGDGHADMTILSSSGAWHFYNADGSYYKGIWIGSASSQLPVPGDYDGNGTDDVVVFRGGAWLAYDFATGAYRPSASRWTGAPMPPPGGVTLPAPLDYNADGRLDMTVYAGGPWHFYDSDGSYLKGIWVGAVAGDRPISRRPLP